MWTPMGRRSNGLVSPLVLPTSSTRRSSEWGAFNQAAIVADVVRAQDMMQAETKKMRAKLADRRSWFRGIAGADHCEILS
jgi:hypothetical protein